MFPVKAYMLCAAHLGVPFLKEFPKRLAGMPGPQKIDQMDVGATYPEVVFKRCEIPVVEIEEVPV